MATHNVTLSFFIDRTYQIEADDTYEDVVRHVMENWDLYPCIREEVSPELPEYTCYELVEE